MKPYYKHAGIVIYNASCEELLAYSAKTVADILLTDPPFGIDYKSGYPSVLKRSIWNDTDTAARDNIVAWWGDRPALIFGTWKMPKPYGTHSRLIWDTKGALGMGDLRIPWKPSDQEIYVIGQGFSGRRDSNVLRYAPVQSMAKNGRLHPHQKPIDLLNALIQKCPGGKILDPFSGSGSTAVAAKLMGRECICYEVDERDCEIAAKRLAQEVLF